MKQTLTLDQWLTAPRPAETPVAWLNEHTWTLGHLRHDTALLITALQQQQGERWALCFESNSYLFMVALLATLHAGKTPVILGHCRASLLNEQRALFDGVLCDDLLDWQGPLLIVSSEYTSATDVITFPTIRKNAFIELFTSGSTSDPKRVIKLISHLDNEAALLASCFADRLAGCRVIASVSHQHLYGLTFRIFLPMALGLQLHAVMLFYAEQLAALSHKTRYAFISSPAFLKRLDLQLSAPPVAIVLSAGGLLPWQDAIHTETWLNVWPDEIYGSTETGILAWRYRQQDSISWSPFPGVFFRHEDTVFRVFSPLIDVDGLILDDNLQFDEHGQFRLLGRRGQVVKIEDKRISLRDIEQRLLELDGIREAAALKVSRKGREGIGVLLVLDDEARQRWQNGGGKTQKLAWRRALLPWVESVAIPRYWRVIDEIPVNSMNKRVYRQLQDFFHESP